MTLDERLVLVYPETVCGDAFPLSSSPSRRSVDPSHQKAQLPRHRFPFPVFTY